MREVICHFITKYTCKFISLFEENHPWPENLNDLKPFQESEKRIEKKRQQNKTPCA